MDSVKLRLHLFTENLVCSSCTNILAVLRDHIGEIFPEKRLIIAVDYYAKPSSRIGILALYQRKADQATI
jgi:hypothetical protein